MIVAVLYEQTGSIRTAFIYLAVVLIIPILMLLFCINIKEGIESAGKTGKLVDGGTSKGVEMPKVKVCVGPSSVDDVGVGSSAVDDAGVGSSAVDDVGVGSSAVDDVGVGSSAVDDAGVGSSAVDDAGV